MYEVDENDRVVTLEGIPQSSVSAPELSALTEPFGLKVHRGFASWIGSVDEIATFRQLTSANPA